MNKPLHKDPSFWIVAATLVGAALLVQWQFALPWLHEKIVASRPAPRMTNFVAQVRGPIAFSQLENLDNSKKTYPWQRPRPDPRLLQDTPPQVVLIPTEYTSPSGGWGTGNSNSTMGIRMGAAFVVGSAYNWRNNRRILHSEDLPPGEYDFIANLPSGSLEALQTEIKKKWGFVAEHQIVQTNAVVLKLDHTNAPGLRPVINPSTPPQSGPGNQTVRAQLGNFITPYLENILQQPVIDQTGLSGPFDIDMSLYRRAVGPGPGAYEQTRQLLLDQFGLDLVQTNTAVEMLVLKKVKEDAQ